MHPNVMKDRRTQQILGLKKACWYMKRRRYFYGFNRIVLQVRISSLHARKNVVIFNLSCRYNGNC